MPTALSVDLRERVVAAVSAGASCHQAAARFGVSVSSASRWSERYRSKGQVGPRPRGGDRRAEPIEQDTGLIRSLCETQPGIFLRELRDRLAEKGVQTSTSGLSRFFKRQGITRKKGRRTPPSRSART
jgi:transposase